MLKTVIHTSLGEVIFHRVKGHVTKKNQNKLEEMKEELYNIYGKEQLDFYEELLSSVSNVDVSKAMSMLM